jgi:hypothetical protein
MDILLYRTYVLLELEYMNISGFFLERGFTDVVQGDKCFHGEMCILPAGK